ncbi:MAG: urocanate hydratase [Anaerophaga sp.]|nr:urocanate hydratase [Anaerophaga sp.]
MFAFSFQQSILQGIPDKLPEPQPFDPDVNHAPRRKDILSEEEKKLAVKNALRYFPVEFHKVLAPEFLNELNSYGRIYMYRFRPRYEMKARPIDEYPHRSQQAAAIMLMISNNLDPAVAQHPHELITYGGNGAVFQNWAQYLLTMQYLATMSDDQTLVLYSGHPLGIFPSSTEAPRVVVTNGMVVPNYSSPDHWERFNALGVSQYGQMTAGSFMYIGPQGIVHGTTITIMNALRRLQEKSGSKGRLFVTAGLGGMSGAQPKAAGIAGCVSVTAEVNPKAIQTRYSQGWVDEVMDDLDFLKERVLKAVKSEETVSSDAFRGATWVSLHNGGGVGWGEVINGGFGMVLDGTEEASRRVANMLFWDVNNGISRRSWARNKGALFAAQRAMHKEPRLKITMPNLADDDLIESLF